MGSITFNGFNYNLASIFFSLCHPNKMAAPSIPKGFPSFLKPYVGNRHLFKSLTGMEATNPYVAQANSVLNIAPTFKWALSVVPMMGIFSGNPPVEKIDLLQTVALFSTGVVWGFYAVIIRPQFMVTLEDVPKGTTAQELVEAGKAFGVSEAKVVDASGKSRGVLAFTAPDSARSLLDKGTLQVGAQACKTGAEGLNWFTKMLPGSRALFLVNVCLATVHGWNLRRKYVYTQQQAKEATATA